MSKPLACIRLKAPNDSNGNPRRVHVALEKHDSYVGTFAVFDEGYRGEPDACKGVSGPEFNITPKEYGEIRKEAKARGKWRAS